ncbi:MAG: DUF2804 domain-containing protein [Spirochaetaceae bacterium]|jgi:hypothetical protein|nr:DUF2804 domain-containing protein [Spirochaetaceae bacterium]
MAQIEITEHVPLINDEGIPINCGWARYPYFNYTPFIAPRRCIIESDRYIVLSTTHIISFELCDTGYLGYIGAQIFSLKDSTYSTQVYTVPFSMGCFDMPPSSLSGSVKVVHKDAHLHFISMENGARIIKADFPHFGHHRSLRGELVLIEPAGMESMVTHSPWLRNRNAFRCLRCSPWYYTEGVVQFGSTEIVFTKSKAWGIFIWERGVRPRTDAHFWASGCGMSDNRQISFSVGYSSADSSNGTENVFFFDGRLYKLDQVTFLISPNDWLKPWHFTSSDNRIEMEFKPHNEIIEYNQVIFHIEKRRRVFGSFSGTIILDDGSERTFHNITGIAERRKMQF